MRNSISSFKSNIIPVFLKDCRYLVFLLFALLSSYGCKGKKEENKTYSETSIEFRNKHIDFGKISEGNSVSKYYYFKNTGKENLLIKNIEAGCGCTAVNYPQKPIPPGKEEKIEIIFNSSGRYGKQYKEISIFANIPEGKKVISFSADIR